jgi:hypothetical protein
MKAAVWLVAFICIVVGIAGLVSPDSLMTVRRLYAGTPAGLYTASAVRVAMGLVLLLFAPTSRAPRTLRVLGALMCAQGVAAALFGSDRSLAIIEWEAMQSPALLRLGAAVALATGAFVGFASTDVRRVRL